MELTRQAGKGRRQVRGKKKPDHSDVYKTGPGTWLLFEGSGELSNSFKQGSNHLRGFVESTLTDRGAD